MKRIARFATAFVLTLGIAACGDDSTGPGNGDPQDGTFSVTISGDIEDSFEGQAFFGEGTDPDTQEDAWVLWLTTTESQATGRALYFVRNDTRPGEGTHGLLDLAGDDDLETGGIGAAFYDYSSQAFVGAFVSTGGVLVIDESDDDEMEGSFTVQAAGTIIENNQPVEATVTITGEFDADGGNVFYPGF